VPGPSNRQKPYAPTGPAVNFHQQCWWTTLSMFERLIDVQPQLRCDFIPMEGWYRNGEPVSTFGSSTKIPKFTPAVREQVDVVYRPPGEYNTNDTEGTAKRIREEVGFYDVDPDHCNCPEGQHEKVFDAFKKNDRLQVWITGSELRQYTRKVKCVPGYSKKQKPYSPHGPTVNFHQQCWSYKTKSMTWLLKGKPKKVCDFIPMEGWYRNGVPAIDIGTPTQILHFNEDAAVQEVKD
jgi:hypothetical protein